MIRFTWFLKRGGFVAINASSITEAKSKILREYGKWYARNDFADYMVTDL